MSGRHRWTRAGLKLEIDHLRSVLRAAQLKATRLERQHQIDSREIARLQDVLQAWQSRWANAHPVSVPAPRDLRPADERPTAPTDVSKVRAIYPVVPIAERRTPDAEAPIKCPAPTEATTPGHVPAWAMACEPGPAA